MLTALPSTRHSRAGSFLDRMARSSRQRVREAREKQSEGALLQRALSTPPPPPLNLSEFDVIAELKLRSPAAGELTDERFDRDAQIGAYAAGGASAVSVLTEPQQFKGSLEDLNAAATSLMSHGVPTMRKDFLTDPYQVLEARAAGASGVLIIVTMLDDSLVTTLLEAATECGLFVLLEAFDERDLERISTFGITPRDTFPVLCGVNCRDLASLEVDFDRFRQLATHLPRDLPAVAESGISRPADVATIAGLGYRAALVGSALMGSPDPAAQLVSLKQAGIKAGRGIPCS